MTGPLDRGKNVTVHPIVRNLIIIALAVPPVALLWSVALAALGLAYQIATNPTAASTVFAGASLPPMAQSDVVVLGALAAVALLYLTWANVVFGTENVDDAITQGQDLKDTVNDEPMDSGDDA